MRPMARSRAGSNSHPETWKPQLLVVAVQTKFTPMSTTVTGMEPYRKCGKALECAQHIFIDIRTSSDMFEGQNQSSPMSIL
jgi:hypothetical protein